MERQRLYAFDIDVNLFHFPSKIVMEYYEDGEWIETEVNSVDYVDKKERDDYRLSHQSDPFFYFDNDKTFLKNSFDVIESYPEKVGISFDKFKRSLKQGDTLSLITARGHDPNTIRAFLINLILFTKDKEDWGYVAKNPIERVNNIFIYPVCSDEFNQYFGTNNDDFTVPFKKKMAFRDFIMKNGSHGKISIGYSDDDPKNIESVEHLIQNELIKDCPHCHFVMYDTSKGEITKKALTLKNRTRSSSFVKKEEL